MLNRILLSTIVILSLTFFAEVYFKITVANQTWTKTAGFLTEDKRFYPRYATKNASDTSKVIIPNASDKTIIIYNHGTTDSWLKENCDANFNQMPARYKKLQNKDTVFYYLCSTVTDYDKPGTYTERRTVEISALLDKLINAGVKPKNIFIIAHSSGSWATLLLNKQQKKKFNAFFLTAPAMAGKVAEMNTRPLYKKAYYQHLDKFNHTPQKGIIVFYTKDRWVRQSDWNNFKQNHSSNVDFYTYRCLRGHFSSCNSYNHIKVIKQFMKKSRQGKR
ncbi:MAG: hypothetical protein ACPG8V_00645 [Alphaproteobacteria bacterium]